MTIFTSYLKVIKKYLSDCWAKTDNAYKTALLKDAILDQLIEKNDSTPYPIYVEEISLKTDIVSFSIGDVFKGTAPAILTINILAKEIARQGKLSIQDIPDLNGGKVYLLTIREEGIYFRNVEGGYVNLYWKSFRQNIWLIAKTFAAVFNACALIYLAYLQVQKDVSSPDKPPVTSKASSTKSTPIKDSVIIKSKR